VRDAERRRNGACLGRRPGDGEARGRPSPRSGRKEELVGWSRTRRHMRVPVLRREGAASDRHSVHRPDMPELRNRNGESVA